MPQPAAKGTHVELVDISKSFGGVRALDEVSLKIGRGSIHALVGENGAGKSTLGKILAGVITPDRGQLLIDGEPVTFHSPREAITRGIVLIAQELSIAPALSVAENVFLGTEPRRAGFVARRALRRRYDELAAAAGFELRGDLPGRGLRTADQQKVEILRALCRNARLIVMDEPTAALCRPDVERLHKVIRRLAAGGTTVVLVSHFLREVLELADEVTILRDGRLVRTAPAADETEETMLSAMLGRSLGATFPARRPVPADAPVRAAGARPERTGRARRLARRAGRARSSGWPAWSARAAPNSPARCAGRQRVAAGTVTTASGPLAGGRPGARRRPERLRPARARRGAARRAGHDPRVAQGTGPAARPPDHGEREPGQPRPAQPARPRPAPGRAAGRDERARPGRRARPAQAAPVGTLSGGNQQKVLFARMLLCGRGCWSPTSRPGAWTSAPSAPSTNC